MGSSSAFVVGFLNCINAYSKKISVTALAKEAINFEQNVLKENVGSQDQVAAAIGGFNNILFDKKIFSVKKIELQNIYKKT